MEFRRGPSTQAVGSRVPETPISVYLDAPGLRGNTWYCRVGFVGRRGVDLRRTPLVYSSMLVSATMQLPTASSATLEPYGKP